MTEPLIDISLQCRDVVSYAAAYNRRPTALQLELRPRDGRRLEDIEISVQLFAAGEELSVPWLRRVAFLGAEGLTFSTRDLAALQPNATTLLQQRELRWGSIEVEVRQEGTKIARASREISVLAASGWVDGRPAIAYAPLLAAFVQPQEPALMQVLKATGDFLARNGRSTSIEGYQASSPNRVDEIVEGIYESVRARRLGYINPPAGWDLDGNPDTAGQRIRLPGEVLSEGLATCLDSTILMASLIEAAGLRPLVFVIPGHAFVGYWRMPEQGGDGEVARVPTPAIPVREVHSFVESGMLALIETTAVCGADSQPFAAARRAARAHLNGSLALRRDADGSETVFDAIWDVSDSDACVLDVAYERQANDARPIPVRVAQADGSVSVVEYRPQEFSVELLKSSIGAAGEGASAGVISRDAPARVKRWQDSLLDLSLRNRLLKYPTIDRDRSGIGLFAPSDTLGVIEDLLQKGQPIRLRHAPMTGDGRALSLSLRRTSPPQFDVDLTRLLVTERALATAVPAPVFAKTLRRMQTAARAIVDETGSNGLYLAIGMVAWRPSKRTDEAYAPLILVPVTLKSSNRNREFALEIDPTGAVTPNFSLAEKLKQDTGIDLPGLVEPATDGAGIDIDALIAYVRGAFLKAGLTDFRVDPAATLGFFDFSTYRLWRDLQEHWPRFAQNSVLVRHLVETPFESFADADERSSEHEVSLDDFAAALPVLADGSQARAVLDAMQGKTFVLQGPPGSGKSQTITNLLARALHGGKRVLFVAEKPGALGVVRDRLAAVGLGAFGLNLHDKGMRPADVRQQLRAALEAAAHDDRVGFDAAQQDLDRQIAPLQRYPLRLHAQGRLGESAYSARDRLLAIPGDATLPVPASLVRDVPPDALPEVRRRLRDVRDAAATAGPARSNPWSFATLGADALSAQQRGHILELLRDLGAALERIRHHPRAVDALAAMESVGELLSTRVLADRVVDLRLVDASAPLAARQARAHLEGQIGSFATGRHFANASPRIAEAPVAELRAAADAAMGSFFLGRNKRIRAVIARVQSFLDPGAVIEREQLVSTIDAIAVLQREVHGAAELARSLPGVFVPPNANLLLDVDRAAIMAQLRRVEDDVVLAAQDGSDARERVRVIISAGPEAAAAIGRIARGVHEVFGLLHATEGSVALWLGTGRPADVVRGAGAAWVEDASQRDLLQLRRWLVLRDLLQPLEALGLGEAVATVLDGRIAPAEAELGFERGLLAQVLRQQLDAEGLDAFDGAQHDASVQGYAFAASELRRLAPGVLAGDMIGARGFKAGVAVGAVGELRRELGKQRGWKPIRRLLREHWNVVSRISPLVLAVPDALVRFVDGDLEPFDLVVFDEASQIKVAHAIGALGRGRAAIVVGDSQQMPPTSVAQAATGQGEGDVDTSGLEDEALPPEEESILSEAVRANVPEIALRWHYRSEDETLIAFSNANYYDKELQTLPSPSASRTAKGLSFVQVPGSFVRSTAATAEGPRGTNRVEAAAIVAEIRRRLADPALGRRSIGVVTFNQPQQRMIREMLDAAAITDERLLLALNGEPDPALENGLDQRALDDLRAKRAGEVVKVWNLESVQGQERDDILFSVAFSKDAAGRLARNFGPLTHQGGERRLNVAVTRARQQVIVFCSFEPEALVADGLSGGLVLLAEYLRLAKYGPSATGATGATEIGAPDRHREQIAQALRDRGLRVATEFGLSKFKVDLAVAADSPEGTWPLAVLLDGRAWRERATVGDRDALPITLLRDRMGWSGVARVWTPDWLRDPTGAVDRIVGLVRELEAAPAQAEAPQSVSAGVSSAVEVQPSAPPRSSLSVIDDPRSVVLAAAPRSAAPAPLVHEPADPFEDVPRWQAWRMRSGPAFALDQLDDGPTQDYVHRIVDDIIATEGLVHADRAAKLIARMHGLERVRQVRVDALRAVIDRAFRKTDDGFYVPRGSNSDDARWSRSAGDRVIEEISLVEIGSAMRAIAEVGMGASREELVTSAAQDAFGFSRLTAAVRARFEAAVEDAVRRGVLRHDGDHVVAV